MVGRLWHHGPFLLLLLLRTSARLQKAPPRPRVIIQCVRVLSFLLGRALAAAGGRCSTPDPRSAHPAGHGHVLDLAPVVVDLRGVKGGKPAAMHGRAAPPHCQHEGDTHRIAEDRSSFVGGVEWRHQLRLPLAIANAKAQGLNRSIDRSIGSSSAESNWRLLPLHSFNRSIGKSRAQWNESRMQMAQADGRSLLFAVVHTLAE